ncbi:MAG: hypothetical protein JNM39_01810 [Bdellovibrionaceae bacterium]|nr:hypothetical protein [Pseudobdellovibrionaceae bacterium]
MIFVRLSVRLGLAFLAIFLLANSVSIASNARLTALGQDKSGSLLIEDERNIFLNPGYLGTLKNAANFELGASSVTTSASNSTASSPKAEGGIVYGLDSLVTAIQVGRTHRLTESMINNSRLSTGGFFIPQNSLELMLGRGGDLSWGGSVHYAKTASDRGQTANFPDSEASILSFSGGVYKSSFAAFASVDLIHKSETKDSIGTPEKYEGKVGYMVGGSFNLNAFNKVCVTMDSKGFAFNNGAGIEGDSKSLQTVLNYFHRFSDEKVFLFVIAGLSRGETVVSYAAPGSNNEKLTTWSLPLSLGLEIPANSWLTLQTSVKQGVLINSSNATNGITDLATNGLDDTKVSAGASLAFERIKLDATLEGADSGSGKVNGSTLLANVGLKYAF